MKGIYPIYVRKKGTEKWFPLYDYPMTQNEVGVYYYSSILGYAHPKIWKFDTYDNKLYTKRTDGSHKNFLSQRCIDLLVTAEYEFTFGRDFSMIKSSAGLGSFCLIVIGNERFYMVHTDRWIRNGNYKAYTVAGMIGNIQGFSQHLHIYSENIKTKGSSIKQHLLNHRAYDNPPIIKPPVVDCCQQVDNLNRSLELALKDIELLRSQNEVLKSKIENAIKILS